MLCGKIRCWMLKEKRVQAIRFNNYWHHVNGIRMLRRLDIHVAIVEDNNIDIEECGGNCDVRSDSDVDNSNSESEGGHMRPKLTLTAIVRLGLILGGSLWDKLVLILW